MAGKISGGLRLYLEQAALTMPEKDMFGAPSRRARRSYWRVYVSDSNGKKPTGDQPASSLGPATPKQLLAETLRFLGKIDRDPSALRAAKKLEEIDRAVRRPKKPWRPSPAKAIRRAGADPHGGAGLAPDAFRQDQQATDKQR